MAKQLNVNLAFTADTGKAKAQLQDLQRQLDSLMKKSATTTDGLGLTKDLMKATEAAGELKMMLEAATTPTGKLDLGAFNQAIQKSGRKLSDYAADLNSLGADGQKAFANIAKAISTAEMPLRRTNGLLSEFAVTLKNTARWQISSSILHGFMGSVQSAYGYAQDLNKSLNDIRIVTGQSTDQMAEFAANANKAAKELSTTTTAYTNAALIYYQQGDDDATVLEKTDVTTKMANVTGQEASVVSDQLTAIWNNFNKTGEESYEKYADILTALGAETASSTDEIAGGLEKFASIADMIGLSYEYAATALATITATTRQSEDVVGTALKTIFARIQGLNLGETLDDGTTLNKYSEALEKVGISIFEQNGELKNMDSILDEMGAKWKTLSDDQQVALAQTVAGVRQYNQLVSLMDNWDYFGENLAIAEGAEGELDRQANTYAESWEAARKRVQASAQSIYQTLIDDDFFIGLSNTFADLLSVIKGTIDGLGGLPGVLTLISSLMLQSFGPGIADSINNTFYNLTYNTQTARDELRKLREDAVAAMASLGDDSIAGSAAVDIFREQGSLQDQLLAKTHELERAGKSLSDEEQKRAQLLMDTTEHIGQQVLKAAELRQEEESVTKTIADRISQESLGQVENLDQKIKNVQTLQVTYTALSPIITQVRDEMEKAANSGSDEQKARAVESVKFAFEQLKTTLDKAGISFDGLEQDAQDLLNRLFNLGNVDFNTLNEQFADIDQDVKSLGADAQVAFNNLRQELMNVEGIDKAGVKKLLDDLKTSLSTTGRLTAEQIQQFRNFGIAVDETGKIIEGFKGKVMTFADGMVALGSILSSFASVLLSIKGLSDIWTNEDLTTGEKVLRTLTTLGMILPMLTRLFDAQNLAKLAALKIDKQQIKTTIIKIAGLNAETVANKGLTAALWKKVAAYMAAHWQVLAIVAAMTVAVGVIVAVTNAYNEEANAAKRASEAANNLSNSAKDAQNSVNDLLSTFDSYDSAIDKLEECAEKLDGTAESTENWQNALNDVNDQMWEILDKYPELAKMDNIFEDGLLNHDVLDEYIAQQKKVAENARAAALTASARASKAQVKADETALKREINVTISQNTYPDDQGTTTLQNQAHAQKMFADLYEKAQSEKFNTEEFNTAVNEYIEGFSMTTDGFEDEIRDTADKIRDLGKASIQASTQMENAAKLLANQILGGDATEDQINDFATKYAEAEEQLYNEVIDQTRNGINKLSGKNDAEVKALWDRYQKATGTNYHLSSNAVQGTDYNRSFEYINEEGIKVVIFAEELAAAIAASEAQSETQEDFRDNLFDANSGALGFFGSDVIKDGVDTSLLNSLAETMDLEDAETVAALQTILNDKQTAAEQIAEINKLLGSMTEEEKAQAEIDSLTKNAVDNYELDADDIEDQAKRLQEAYQLTSVEATKLAIENQRMNKGVETLSENWKDWQKVLKKGALDKEEKLTLDYTNTIQDLTKAVADLTGASEDLELPDEFFESEENLKLIEEAAKGSEQAINELGVAVGYASVQLMELKAVTDENGSILNQSDIDAFNTNKEVVLAGIAELQAKVAEGTDLVGQGINAILSGGAEGASSWVTSLNEMAMATNMTVEEMNALLGQLGLEADVTTTDVEQDVQVPVYKVQMSNVETDPETGFTSYTTRSIPMGTETHKGKISVAQIGVNGVDPGAPDVKYIGNGPVSPSSVKPPKNTGGNKGSKPKKVNKNDIVDRYKEINDQLDNIKDTYEDISKEADRLYGTNKINALKKANNELQKEIGLLEKKKEEAQKYLKIDKEALELAAKRAGVQLEFKDDEIINYTIVLEELYNQLKALTDAAGETVDEAEQKAIDDLQEKINELKAAIKAFDDTKELIEDIDNDIKDKFYEWQDNNYEALQLKLELKLEINDAELKKLEYFLGKYSDNFYKMAESAALMNDKIDPTIQNLEDYKNHKEALDAAYASGQISQEAYVEGLKEVREGYYANLEALIELDKQMMHYYGDTLDAAQAEIDSFTDHMEHLTSVFDHYMSLMEILGKQKDYNAMGNFLEGKADTIRDRLDVAKEYYEMLKENSKADEYWANYQAALSSGDEDMAQWWKEQWDAEVDALDAAQEEMLSLTEEWAEAMKAVIENNMTKIAETLEKTLTKLPGMDEGFGFDYLMDSFDKLNTRQEEYLTKTNQIYETNKLMRTASKALDETDNKVAKQKLKNFIDETKSLQENTQLSKYELEIQQAKYDLLLAEIALEEAQNAKSTVRLSRDSEGNFGYVYSADQDTIADAEQGVDDAENNLYNLSLEGQQKYTEKYLQAQQQMFNDLDELWRLYYEDHAIDEAEYNRRYEEIYKYYYGDNGILATYAHLYNIGVQADANATADNWQKDYGAMTQNTEAWASAVNTYYEGVKGQITEWENLQVQANEDVEGALNDSETATKELKEESNRLAEALKTKVIPAIDSEIKSVQAQTAAYAAQRKELLALIEEYEKYLDQLNQQVAVASVGFDENTDYSALMNEYLNKGGKIGDATYNELLKQRNAKIDWLESRGYDSSYWGTRGDETTTMYNALAAGGSYTMSSGKTVGQDWYQGDYVADDQLAAIFEALGVPLGALEEVVTAIKETTDAIKEATTTTGENTVNKIGEASEATNTKIGDIGDNVTNKVSETGEATVEKVGEVGETTNNSITESTTETVSTLNDVANIIKDSSDDIVSAIGSAASTVASSVGGAISSIRSDVSALSARVSAISANMTMTRMATGGYTGEWGPEGKLAVLDEKELVLNKSDTGNILQAVSIIREISDMIDIQAGMTSLFTAFASPHIATTSNETLEQTVTIHAEFPNATNHSEIEEAFNTLVNRASQFANRK